jgi:hypothetical protein
MAYRYSTYRYSAKRYSWITEWEPYVCAPTPWREVVCTVAPLITLASLYHCWSF